MHINFDILEWWNSLDDVWKMIFENNIQKNTLLLKIKKSVNKELSKEEEVLLKFKSEFEKNNTEMKILAINALLELKSIIVGRIYKFDLENIQPLLRFRNLEKIEFRNCDIKEFISLDELKYLKIIDFTNAQISARIIEEFKKKTTIEIITK